MTHYYAWKNNSKRATLYKRRFKVLARLHFNSALVEFENGQRECISRNAMRRLTPRAADLADEANNRLRATGKSASTGSRDGARDRMRIEYA